MQTNDLLEIDFNIIVARLKRGIDARNKTLILATYDFIEKCNLEDLTESQIDEYQQLIDDSNEILFSNLD